MTLKPLFHPRAIAIIGASQDATRIAPVKELFRLQGASELQEAEERYLPKKPVRSRALILAASRGAELGELTEQRPKTMVKVRGRPLLSHIVSGYNAAGIKRIQVVRGFCAAAIDLPSLSYTDNDEYADSGELLSLAKGLAGDPDDSMDLFVCYGDVIFNHWILDALNEVSDAFAIAVQVTSALEQAHDRLTGAPAGATTCQRSQM